MSSRRVGGALIREIETSKDDLQSRAIAILKAKNRLSADDAKLVEEAFAARMAQQEHSVGALTTDQSAPVSSNPILPPSLPASGDVVKRPRGRPRKIQTLIEKAAVVMPPPTLTIPPPST